MYSKCYSFVIITLITFINIGKSERRNSIFEEIPKSGRLINDTYQFFGNFDNSSSNQILKEPNGKDYRLPTIVIPYLYDISIFLKNDFTYNGIAKINVSLSSTTDEIVLHHGKMNVTTVTITFDDEKVEQSDTIYDPITEKFTIKLKNPLKKDLRILIAIEYNAELKNNLIGFYKSSYFNPNDQLKYLAATQFQAVHARHAFPCFDEPMFKAKFLLRVRYPIRYNCISNMPVNTLSNSSNFHTVFFKKSMVMSTYLTAFVISDFVSKGTETIKVWSREVLIDQGDYALELAKKSVFFYQNIFKQKYPIGKMDMVAVPDFAAGAMENWGLITYKESSMLYHPEESSDYAKQKIAATIIHEWAHMWFGNLVTPNWWGVLWLSEGFATYFEHMATAKIEDQWNMDEQFLVLQHQVAFSADGLDSSLSLTRDVNSQSEIGQSGDTITYKKGASVLRMMEMSFGSQIFEEALINYLELRKYSTALPDDLWMLIQKQVDLESFTLDAPIKTIMDIWTKQAGFPVVSIFIKEGKATLSQKRFLLRNPDSVQTNSSWWIPITWTTKSNPDFVNTIPRQWIYDNKTIEIQAEKDNWIVFNIKAAGFYRVNYDTETWYRIINTLNNKKSLEDIHVLNRAAIVDDLMNLARADHLDYNIALDGLKYLMEEMHYLPYKASLNALQYLTQRFSGQSEYDIYIKFILTLIDKTYRKLTYDDKENDNHLIILLRQELNELACRFNNEKCVKKSLKYFEEWKSGALEKIPKNRKFTVYATAMKNATESDWNTLWNRYLKINIPTEQIEILRALGCIQNSTILEKYLLWAVSNYEEHRIRKHDSKTVFDAVSSCSSHGTEYIIDFIDKHYQKIVDYNDGSYESISTILSTASEHFSTQELIDKYEKLINSHKKEFESILPSLESHLKLAKYELEWYKKHVKTIIDWINKFNYKEDTSKTTDYLLPQGIVPTKYNVHVIPHIKEDNFTFNGTVEIETTVNDLTDKIILHSFELVHHDIIVIGNGQKLEVKNITYSRIYNFLTIILEDDLFEGTILNIKIEYSGILNNKMRGFYRSSYKDNNGKTRWIATTHLEPVGARRMFPCFDEPAMKAVFTISVTRPKSYHAISNMPLKSTRIVTDDLEIDIFNPTPRMSTYLVALIVSQFANQTDNKNHTVWARPNGISQTSYALSIISPIIKFYEDKLGLKYQLPKMDMAAIPDFASGAMENWGLITYRESRMLYDPKKHAINAKQAICLVIAHEITHQWFGNLVSPRWWKYLWLNEGFARYLQYASGASVETSWKLPPQFVVDHLQTSFGTDGLTSSHPITHDVYNPSQISGIFDAISYAKAASILRMTEKILGSKIFYQSFHKYLSTRQYDVATPEDLYEAIQDQVDAEKYPLEVDVKTFLDSWTLKAGFPVVSVTINGHKVTLSQERFLLRNTKNEAINQTWWVPITWTTQNENDFNNTVPKYWLKNASSKISIKRGDPDWVIFNIQQSGYYRVNYDSHSWWRIIDALKSPKFVKIHEINRATLMDDLLNLGRTGYVTYDKVLSATQYLKKETNYLAWKAAFNGLSYLNKRFAGRDIYDLFKTHILTILQPIFEKLGVTEIEGEDHYDRLLRILVVNWACKFELTECVSQSKKIFGDWKGNFSIKVPANQRRTLYCTAIKNGSEDNWEFLMKQYLASDDSREKVVILQALSCSRNPELLNKLLSGATTKGTEIRFQDSSKVFTYVHQASLIGANTVLEFVETNYFRLKKYYGEEKPIETILNGVFSKLSTKELRQKAQALITSKKCSPKMKMSLKSYLSRADYELIWYDKYTPKIWEWLETTYPSEDYRLPNIVKPLKYGIYLAPYFEERNFTFSGNVTISLQTANDTSRIILQANELNIQEVKVYYQSGKELIVSSWILNKNTHRFSIYLTTTIKMGSAVNVTIQYSGVLNDEMRGFYRSSYTNENEEIRWLATTHLQPTYARQVFPCFDEPSFKAKFTINIERPNNYQTLSNMPLKSSQHLHASNRTLDHFEESEIMSSYLVAFVVSDFSFLTNADKNVSVWTRPNAIENAQFSLVAATKLIKLLEEFTGISYILPKLDLVAVPDFKAGAMENWGLVTFREYGLLYRDDVTLASYRRYINTTIAHEFAHTWFGDLVTCDWWDYTWLNEGFAQYFQYIIVNSMEPNWKLLEQFVPNELHTAFEADASKTTHPLNNHVFSPQEISDNFDKITYKKGASVIRMMHNSYGSQVFKKGIHDYLSKYQFKTALPEYLWESMQAQADKENIFGGKNISLLMDSWTSQPGYPVVNVTLSSGQMTLKQEQFLLSRSDSSPNNRTYWIPITYTNQSKLNFEDTSPIFWFGNESMTVDIDMKDEWYILNVQEFGYYRVNYDSESWYRLIDFLNSEKYESIHVINRAQIINDVLNLARAGYVNYTLALDATSYVINEHHHLPWKALLTGFSYLNMRFKDQEIHHLFAKHVLTLLQGIYEKLGFHDSSEENQLNQLNRALILSWACYYQHADCVKESKLLFSQWQHNSSQQISPNAKEAVYCTALEHGTYEDWDFLWNEYLNTNFPSEKVTILQALSCTKNATTLSSYLKIAMSSNLIRKQDIETVFTYVYGAGKIGLETCLQFLMENYNALYSSFGNWNDVSNIFVGLASYISTSEQITMLEKFVEENSDKLTEMSTALNNAVSNAKVNEHWFNLHEPEIYTWLLDKYNDKYNKHNGKSSEIIHWVLALIFLSIILLIALYRACSS